MIIPTRRVIRLMFLPLLVLLIGGGSAVAVELAWVLLGLLFVAWLMDGLSTSWSSRLVFRRETPTQLFVDQPHEIVWIVENRSGAGVWTQLRDLPPAGALVEPDRIQDFIPAGSRTRLTYSLTPTLRGNQQFGDLHYRIRGALGLAWYQGRSSASAPVRCYPHLANWMAADLVVRSALMRQAGNRRYRWRGTGTVFESLRDYTTDDDIRWVDWKATARAQRPISRNYETERYQQVLLLVDASRMMTTYCGHRTKFDCVLEAAVLAARSVTEQGDAVGLLVFSDSQEIYLHPRRDRMQTGRVMDALYNRQPRLVEPDFETAITSVAKRNRRRSLVILFTDVTVIESARRMSVYVRSLVPRHLPLVATIADETVQRLEARDPQDVEELYQVGVANELQQQRDEILELLRSTGAAVVDAPADQIAVRTIETYLQLKQRMRL